LGRARPRHGFVLDSLGGRVERDVEVSIGRDLAARRIEGRGAWLVLEEGVTLLGRRGLELLLLLLLLRLDLLGGLLLLLQLLRHLLQLLLQRLHLLLHLQHLRFHVGDRVRARHGRGEDHANESGGESESDSGRRYHGVSPSADQAPIPALLRAPGASLCIWYTRCSIYNLINYNGNRRS